ncbi:MAG TPA: response regulator [Bacteroidales bacterium]|nr:response regulator [Bacteroidales bacterium]
MNTYSILVVDDQPEYIQTYAGYFFEEKVPYKIISALNGEMAIDIALGESPDVIIMDWQMPVMDGITAIKEFKKRDQLKDIPIIIATGIMLGSSELKKALEAGASDYISKPIDKIELLARVNSHIKLANYIKTIKSHKELIERERIDFAIHLGQVLKELCLKTEDILQFTFREHKSVMSKIELLKKQEIDEIETLEYITKLLSEISTNYNGYSTICQMYIQEEDFIQRLLQKHPGLLPNEIELCLWLRKNMDSKNIALLTFRSINTVKVARSKLRLKLNLPEEDNLFSYLIAL